MTFRKRAAKACTACRQSKLKCDAVQTFPDKCSRCAKHGALICEFDLGSKYNFSKPAVRHVFKDSTSRRGVEGLNGGLMRASWSSPANTGHTPSGGLGTSESTPSSKGTIGVTTNSPSSFRFPTTQLLPDQQLGSIVVPGSTIIRMFDTFYTDFYPLFPAFTYDYLDPAQMVENPEMHILLWTICLVTCSGIAPELRPAILDSVTSEMPNDHVLGSAVKEICQILSITILCYWQQDEQKMIDGMAVRRSGQAVQTALQMGFHRASLPIENFGIERFSSEHIDQALLCWTACFMCSQTVAFLSGAPCTCPSLTKSTFERLNLMAESNRYLVPWIDQLILTNACRKAIDVMGNNLDSPDGLLDPSVRGSVHRSLLESFSALQSTLHSFPNVDNDIPYKITEVIAMSYKFQVHSFLLMPDTYPADMDTVAIPLYLVAVKSVSLLTYIMSQSRVQSAIPSFVLRYTTAVTAILYALTLCPCGDSLDVDGCKKGVADLYQVMSNLDSLIAKRCVLTLDFLEDMVKDKTLTDEPLFYIKSRMGASATYSVLSRIKCLARLQGKLDPFTREEAVSKKTNVQQITATNENTNGNDSNGSMNSANGIVATDNNFIDYSILDDFWNWDPRNLRG
jgi:hypothetical protein